MTIVFEPKYNVGDIVSLRSNPEVRLVVVSYWIGSINENGEVVYYTIECTNSEGNVQGFREVEIQLVEAYK